LQTGGFPGGQPSGSPFRILRVSVQDPFIIVAFSAVQWTMAGIPTVTKATTPSAMIVTTPATSRLPIHGPPLPPRPAFRLLRHELPNRLEDDRGLHPAGQGTEIYSHFILAFHRGARSPFAMTGI